MKLIIEFNNGSLSYYETKSIHLRYSLNPKKTFIKITSEGRTKKIFIKKIFNITYDSYEVQTSDLIDRMTGHLSSQIKEQGEIDDKELPKTTYKDKWKILFQYLENNRKGGNNLILISQIQDKMGNIEFLNEGE
jgi:hypothetical protein